MKLEDLRKQLATSAFPGDADLLGDMNRKVQELAGGQLVPAMREMVRKYESDLPIRLHYPNRMQFLYMRDRQTFTFALFPELLPVAYQAGRAIGAAFDAPRRSGVTLREAMGSGIGISHAFDYGRQEIVQMEESFATYRTYECADCYGLPNLGLRLCTYEAGVAAGALETTLGRSVEVTEVRCCASGDPFDEFEVRVAPEGGGA